MSEMFDFDGDGNVSHKESATGFLLMLASVIIIGISAITTFGFFSNYFPAIVSPDYIGPMYARATSGLIGVIVFDLMTVTFLLAFLYKAGTPEQRAISLIMTFVTFIFSAVASAAHLYMTASGNMAQDAATLSTLRNVAMLAVVAGVVFNFGAWLLYSRYSLDSKNRVRQADRRDKIMRAEETQADYLDKLVIQKTKSRLEAEADQLADLQAGRIANAFIKREQAQGYDGTAHAPTPAIASQRVEEPQRPFSLPPKSEAEEESTSRPFSAMTQRVKTRQGLRLTKGNRSEE